ncbi:MAG: hypothetical protein JW820_15350 [Spirochaetales bacterium]|nr:hypothetical protein [Spirochaetales bacterium]
MAIERPAFNGKTIRTLLDTHRSIVQIKYLYLKVVQSRSVNEHDKAELKGSIVELASGVNRFFSDLRFAKINRFNFDETEARIGEFITEIEEQLKGLRRLGSKLLGNRVSSEDLQAGESEIDQALLSSRVFEAQALEKDKLDYLNAIRSFLVEVTGGGASARAGTRDRRAGVDRELLNLKIRNFIDGLAGHNANNLDILYKVRTKLERLLDSSAKTNVLAGSGNVPGVLNHGELYVQDHGNGNYTVSYRDSGLAFLFEILPVQELQGRPPVYRGEISGWAETGPSRVEYFLEDEREVIGGELSGPGQAAVVAAFLKKAELEGVYARIRQACEAKAGETERLVKKVEREMRQKVSDALDEAL